MSLLAALRARIEADGPMGIDCYMRLCLTHPEWGYYTTRQVFGQQGDFTTAPEISQIFGELIGAWLAQGWLQMGAPARVSLVEFGPGRGMLMRDALRATKAVPGFHAALSVHLVEISPKWRETQREALREASLPIFWHDDARDLPDLPTLVVANEFFDALPIRQFVGAAERRVGLDEAGAICFVPEGEVSAEICPEGLTAMAEIAALLHRTGGAGLIFDYGYAHGEAGDTLQAVQAHASVDVLHTPGEADLTAHVDFQNLAKIAQNGGMRALGPVGQGLFLERLGGEIRLNQLLRGATPDQAAALVSGWRRLTAPSAMGTLFKALALVPPGWDSVAGFDAQPAPIPAPERS